MIRVRFEGWELKAEGWGLRNDWKIKFWMLMCTIDEYHWSLEAESDMSDLRLKFENWGLKIDGWEMDGNYWNAKVKNWRLRIQTKD